MDIRDEAENLKYTLDVIEEEITKLEKQVNDLENQSKKLSFEDKKRGAYLQLNSQLDINGRSIDSLKKSKQVPYFGRIDFSYIGSDNVSKLYIGRAGISHDNKIIVTDWRAPVSSLYYDSEIGESSYLVNDQEISVNLQLKRQIDIKNGQLINAQDVSLVANDDLLKPYLTINADNQMKTIVASIQKEQNAIIRKPYDTNIIVQGVAGSGKTSVALHRIAFLLYNLSSKISSSQFLVLGPNNYFLDYISSILPELETSSVEQTTLSSFLNEYINDKVKLHNEDMFNLSTEEIAINRRIGIFKTSISYKKILDNFLKDYIENNIVSEDFMIDNQVVFSKEEIRDILFSVNNQIPNFDRVNNYFKANFKNNIEEIYQRLNKKYSDKYMKLPFDDPNRKKIVDKSTQLSILIKKDGIKLLNKYLKKLNKPALEIYMMFIADIEGYDIPLSKKEILYLQKNALIAMKKKQISFEDIPSLIHIKYSLSGKKLDYKSIIIDEAQDYGLFHFDVLKEITENCNFSIYGDLAQSIYPYKSVKSWDDVNSKIFNNECEILYLNKSYRTTIEITENANSVLGKLNLNFANPVIRHGENVLFADMSNNPNYKISLIKKWLDNGYQTSAVICKTEKEAKKVIKELQNGGLPVNYLSEKDNDYNGKIFVLTSAASKGLEFDTVIINNASEENYCTNSDLDMHLLYVASTRALHEQVILYDKQLTKVYDKTNIESMAKQKIKK